MYQKKKSSPCSPTEKSKYNDQNKKRLNVSKGKKGHTTQLKFF